MLYYISQVRISYRTFFFGVFNIDVRKFGPLLWSNESGNILVFHCIRSLTTVFETIKFFVTSTLTPFLIFFQNSDNYGQKFIGKLKLNHSRLKRFGLCVARIDEVQKYAKYCIGERFSNDCNWKVAIIQS